MTEKPKYQPKAKQPPRTVAKVKKALIANHGVQARVAEQFGVTRGTICRFIKKHPVLQKVIDDMIPDVVEMAKENIVGLMGSEDEGVKLRASSKIIDIYGARFGMGTRRHEHGGVGGGPIPVIDLSRASREELDVLERIFGPLAAGESGGRDGGDPPPQG